MTPAARSGPGRSRRAEKACRVAGQSYQIRLETAHQPLALQGADHDVDGIAFIDQAGEGDAKRRLSQPPQGPDGLKQRDFLRPDEPMDCRSGCRPRC